MFQGSRNVAQGGAHRARPGGRRDDERHAPGSTGRTTSRRCPSHQLELALWLEADRMGTLLDALSQENLDNQREVVKNEKRWSYDNRPYGSWNEKLQAPPLPARASRTTTRRSARWRTSTRRRSRTSASSSGPTTRRTTRSCRSSATSTRTRSARWTERYFGGIPANPSIPPLGDLSLPPILGEERRETVHDKVPLPRVYVGFRAPVFGDHAARRPRHRRPDPRRRQGQPAPSPARPRRADRPGRRAVRARLRRRGVDLRRLGDGPAGRRRSSGSRPRSTRSSSGSPASRSRDDELARARALIETEELGALVAGRGAGRPAVDVRDPVRRPGPDQPDAAALPGGHRRADPATSRPTSSGPTTGSS